jgi:NAD(P)-dependent dehydrogenase (short-subunit alcohol dehydrogenase family)
MTQKTIVITGCSSGFGRVTALHLAQRGWRVFATVRKESDAASLLVEAMSKNAKDNLIPVLCDITDEAQVKAMAQTVREAAPALDALLNNAGTAYPAPLELLPLADLRAQLELNVVAQLAVTQALLPLLKAAHGTLINVSSIGGKITFPVLGSYSMSKFALEAMSDAFRVELAPFGVRVVVIEPGSSPTAIWQTSLQRGEKALEALNAGWKEYSPLIETVRESSLAGAAHGFPPQLFAETVDKILNSPRPQTRYALPAEVRQRIFLRRLLGDGWWDKQIRKMLKW